MTPKRIDAFEHVNTKDRISKFHMFHLLVTHSPGSTSSGCGSIYEHPTGTGRSPEEQCSRLQLEHQSDTVDEALPRNDSRETQHAGCMGLEDPNKLKWGRDENHLYTFKKNLP